MNLSPHLATPVLYTPYSPPLGNAPQFEVTSPNESWGREENPNWEGDQGERTVTTLLSFIFIIRIRIISVDVLKVFQIPDYCLGVFLLHELLQWA